MPRAHVNTAGTAAAISDTLFGTITEIAATTCILRFRIGAATPAASRCIAPRATAYPLRRVSAKIRRSSVGSMTVSAVRLRNCAPNARSCTSCGPKASSTRPGERVGWQAAGHSGDVHRCVSPGAHSFDVQDVHALQNAELGVLLDHRVQVLHIRHRHLAETQNRRRAPT
jgi:hypothetical protein